jgi:hypothetical protein
MDESQSQVQEQQTQTLSEHEQAMVDRVDAHEQSVDESMQSDEQRMLAGKYKSVEELEKAYEHLQSKLGQRDDAAESEVTEEPQAASREDAQEVTAKAGFDFQALEGEYNENGGLSAETYKSLEEAGIPQNIVDAYIAGQEALVQNTVSKMHNLVGGESEYNEMMQWAQDTLSAEDINAFNSSLTSDAATELAIRGLYSRYQGEKGPNLIRGNSNAAPTGGFQSKQEMMAEMANPRYRKDPAFRAEVQRRVALSKF